MRIDVSGHSFVFPDKCACCCGVANTQCYISASRSTGKRVVHTKTQVWDVPYCARCASHVMAAKGSRSAALLLVGLSILLAVLVGYFLTPSAGVTIGAFGVVGSLVVHSRLMAKARGQCNAECVSVDKAIAYLGWHGTLHQFEMSSPHYASDFMVVNHTKLVNLSPQARNLLASSDLPPQKNAPRAPRRYMS